MKKKFRALKRSALSLLLALTMTLSFLPAYAQAEGEENLLTNGDFETGGYTGWTVAIGNTDIPGSCKVKADQWDSNNTNFLQMSNYTGTDNLEAEITQTVTLEAGTYTFSIDVAGANEGSTSSNLNLSAISGGQTLSSIPLTLIGWSQWKTASITFTLEESASVTVGVTGTLANTSYCDLDNALLIASQSSGSEGQEMTDISLPNGDFETGDSSNWVLTGFSDVSSESAPNNSSNTLNLWLSNEGALSGIASYSVSLTAGIYQFGFDLSGAESDSGLSYSVLQGGTTLVSGKDTYTTTGWDTWDMYTTDEFTLVEDSEVTFTLSGTVPAEYWGHLDNLTLKGTGSLLESGDDDTAVEADINVEKVSNLSDDFIMGMDISSVMSEFDSGVTYRDFEGNKISKITDFCQFLKKCGVTHIRVRVWNDPYTDDGKGYGGGNNDIDTAVEIAKGCQAAGLKMLVDFHCSDFWTDPAKQQAPKEWNEYTVDQKAKALQEYLQDSLKKINDTDVEIAMVQIGNETNKAFIGESDVTDMCKLFSAGTEAVRTFNEENTTNIKTVIHVTNPESSYMTTWAKNLNDNNVEYDILATSYYPSWHGTFDNLKSQLQTVKSTYRKDVMVAETSYAFTLDDTDGHENTIREGTNDTMQSGKQYPFSPQGQASYLRDLIDVVNSAGGLGVYYWESAWITVGDTTGLTGYVYDAKVEENKTKWETRGSGWASSYSDEYDPDDAGQWYGGSAVDNQALFAADGSPLASINVWNLVKTGAVSRYTSVDSIESPAETIEVGGEYTLPGTVTVSYSNGDVKENVSWNSEDINAIKSNIPGVYIVNGTVSFSKTIDTGTYEGAETASVTYTLTVKEKNLIPADVAGFELTDSSGFTITGNGIDLPAEDDPKEGTKSMHWHNASAGTGSVTYNTAFNLKAGTYSFEAAAQGYAGDTVTLKILNASEDNNVLFSSDPASLTGWKQWQTPSVSFTLNEQTSVKIQIEVDMQAGGWGTVDCLYLYQSADAGEPIIENHTDISEYRNESGNTAPADKDGYIFAGWYTDETCTEAVDENTITGSAYAKYIDEDVLTVKFQIPTATNSASESTTLRLVTSIDSLDYQNVSFEVSYTDSSSTKKSHTWTTKNAYTALTGYNGMTELSYAPDEQFSKASEYFVALNINNIPNDAFNYAFTVTPKWTTPDGTVVEGATRTNIVISNSSTFRIVEGE